MMYSSFRLASLTKRLGGDTSHKTRRNKNYCTHIHTYIYIHRPKWTRARDSVYALNFRKRHRRDGAFHTGRVYPSERRKNPNALSCLVNPSKTNSRVTAIRSEPSRAYGPAIAERFSRGLRKSIGKTRTARLKDREYTAADRKRSSLNYSSLYHYRRADATCAKSASKTVKAMSWLRARILERLIARARFALIQEVALPGSLRSFIALVCFAADVQSIRHSGFSSGRGESTYIIFQLLYLPASKGRDIESNVAAESEKVSGYDGREKDDYIRRSRRMISL